MAWNALRPYGNRILVKLDGKVTSVRGIILPDMCQDQPESATVIAVGRPLVNSSRRVLQPMQLKVGERVAIGKWNGVKLDPPAHDPDGEYYILNLDGLTQGRVNVDEVDGVIEDDENEGART